MDRKFRDGQRVRIKPCKNYPPTKTAGGIRYGIVQNANNVGGMHFVNEERISTPGEWAYIVASYHSPRAGAMWFSESGIEPMRRG